MKHQIIFAFSRFVYFVVAFFYHFKILKKNAMVKPKKLHASEIMIVANFVMTKSCAISTDTDCSAENEMFLLYNHITNKKKHKQNKDGDKDKKKLG